MKYGRTVVKLLTVYFVFSVGVVSVSAQVRSQDKTSWFSTPFAISAGSESVPEAGGAPTTETITIVTPSRLSVGGSTARTQWGAGYQPEFEFRLHSGLYNSWNHAADASFDHRFSRRTRLNFAHSFVKSSDPARTFTDNIFVMPRNNFRENATAVTLSRENSSRTTLNFRFDNTVTRMSTVGDQNSAILNQYGVAATVGVSQKLGARHKLTLSYSLLKFSPYRFDTAVSAAQFINNIPMVQAGIARFAETLATSVSQSSPSPAGMASGGQDAGSSPAPAEATPAPSPSGVGTQASVSVTSPDIAIASPTGNLTGGVAVSTGPVSVSAAPAPAPVTATVTTAPISAPVTATVTVPVSSPVPVPIAVSIPVVAPAPVVPLVPVIAAPVPNPTLPVVGVVTPLPQPTSNPDPTCVLTNITCTTNVVSSLTSPLPTSPTTSIVTKLSVDPAASPAVSASSTPASPTPAPADSGPPLELLGRPFHIISGTYTFTKGPGLLIEFTGGVMRDRDMSYLMGMQVERRFDRLWFAGGYQRFLSFFGTLPFQGAPQSGITPLPNGVRARSLFSAVSGRVGGRITRKTELEMSVSLSNSTANFVAQDIKSVIGRARINYWLTNRMGLFADADTFYEREKDDAAAQFDRHRYFGGLQIRFSPPPAPRQVAVK